MASPFLDFIDSYVPGGGAAVPAWLAALLVKKPSANVSSALPYYQAVAAGAGRANQFADENARMYNEQYRPAAVAFNERAQGVGSSADLNEASDRNLANFRGAFNASRAGAVRSMAGVNPNSGAAQARLGAIDASYAPGAVQALNTGRQAREAYGDTLREKAMPFLATAPNYGAGMMGMNAAGAGVANIGTESNRQFRQEVGDVTKALKIPSDAADEKKRKKEIDDEVERRVRVSTGRFPGYQTPPHFSQEYQ
jgi:hypothetical protein